MNIGKLGVEALKRIYLELRLLFWQIDRRFRKSATVWTKQGGFKVFLAAKESIGRSLYAEGQYEFEFTSAVVKFLREKQQWPADGGGTIIDIGANIGVISIGMLYTRALSRAIAIEPEPNNFSLLQHNVELNKLKEKVVCLPYAVSDQKGEVQFELSNTNFGDHRVRSTVQSNGLEKQNESSRRVINVPSNKLDDLLTEVPEEFTKKIAVVWVDVQGYEGHVFKGGRNLFLTDVPLVAEIWPYGIRRAGMTEEQFCDIARGIWKYYWVRRRNKFVRYPIDILNLFFDELGYEGNHENVIFTK